jgi:hypothetical protein
MSQTAPGPSRFRVRALDADDHHGRIIMGSSFEEAAIAYIEDSPATATEEHAWIRIVVHHMDSGQEHCFRIDPDTGDTAPCG